MSLKYFGGLSRGMAFYVFSNYIRLYHLVSFAWISWIKDLYCTDLRRRSGLSTVG